MGLASIPNITPDISLTREDAINLLITSIAMEEFGLSNILDAEGAKIQHVLAALDPTDVEGNLQSLLQINDNVRQMLDTIIRKEFLLGSKLSDALDSTVLAGPTGPTGAMGPAGRSALNDSAQIYDTAARTVAVGDIYPLNTIAEINGSNIQYATPANGKITLAAAGTYQAIYSVCCCSNSGTPAVALFLGETYLPSSGATLDHTTGTMTSSTFFTIASPTLLSLRNIGKDNCSTTTQAGGFAYPIPSTNLGLLKLA